MQTSFRWWFHLVCFSSLPSFSTHSEEKQDFFLKSANYFTKGNPYWIKSWAWDNDWHSSSTACLLELWGKFSGVLTGPKSFKVPTLHLRWSLLGSSSRYKHSQCPAWLLLHFRAELRQLKFGLCHLHDKRPALVCGVPAGVWRHWVCLEQTVINTGHNIVFQELAV